MVMHMPCWVYMKDNLSKYLKQIKFEDSWSFLVTWYVLKSHVTFGENVENWFTEPKMMLIVKLKIVLPIQNNSCW